MSVTMEQPVADIRRLKLLEDAVANPPVSTFDMGTFGTKTECGTAACAFGGYAIKYGKQEGVPWRWRVPLWASEDDAVMVFDFDYDSDLGTYFHVADHFRITPTEAVWLFAPDRHEPDDEDGDGQGDSQPAVLARIRAFVAAKERD